MAKSENQRQTPGGGGPENKPGVFSGRFSVVFLAAGIAAATWLVLSVCLANQFTNWDDTQYVTANALVKDLSATGLRHLFSDSVLGNYHPFTMLSYALEYHFAELAPWLYHADSLALHVIVTLLVFWLVRLLTRSPLAAAATALLFGLHPMHMESVAWVSGRKDLLMGVFYLLACIVYVYYVAGSGARKWVSYIGVLLLFVCALLSKPVAVTLAPTLLLIDFLLGRRMGKWVLMEKLPHFALAMVFGIISIRVQQSFGAIGIQKEHFTVLERMALGSYALITYLWKAVVPGHLCCFYPYPPRADGGLPMVYYLYPLAVTGVVFLVWKFCRKNRIVVFGLLFFLVNIALLLQFIPVGEAIIADRYSYIPYMGLFLVAGQLMAWAATRRGYAIIGVAAVYLCALGYESNQRCRVWQDSITLWNDELAKEPDRAEVAYENLGFVYFDKWYNATDHAERKVYYDSAFYLMNKTAELWPGEISPYQPLAMLYYSKKNYDMASNCYRTAVLLNPTAEAHLNYANFLAMAGRNDTAIAEYGMALAQDPNNYAPYLSRGKLLRRLNHCEEAMSDFGHALELKPTDGEIYYERSFCDTAMGLRPVALNDVEKAVSLGFGRVDSGYYAGLRK